MMKEQRRGAMAGWMESAQHKRCRRRPPFVRGTVAGRYTGKLVGCPLPRARTNSSFVAAPRVPTTARSGLPFTVSCSRALRAPWFCRRTTF